MAEIIKHINDTNASYRSLTAGDAKNTDLFFDQGHYSFFGGVNRTIKVRLHKTNLSQSILFIASILPRKYDLGAKHYKVEYSSKFVEENLAILDFFFIVDGIKTETRIVEWNVRKDILQKNGKIDDRLYLNGLQFDLPYAYNGNELVNKFSIRNYLAGGYSNVKMVSNEDDIYDLYISNTTEAFIEDDGIVDEIENKLPVKNCSFQQIYYGAPGTGKSHEINRLTKGREVVRTTFHPDSDYSTFVGAYKPTSIEIPVRDVTGKVIVENGNQVTENRIVYEFVEQAFLQAYIKAWNAYMEASEGEKPNDIYLVIEEINRGNCAQIFGDLFQLLDRNGAGFSDYPIQADKDMKKRLAKAFGGKSIADAERINNIYEKDIVSQVLKGEILLLPNNLYIWATMNTSDQSLFPIDSAFKRRWDWQYTPICEGKSKDGQPLGWKIKANGNEYDWWTFIQKINAEIEELTKSEDKKLGYFFCKPVDGIISAETFVGKVIFYLWNDVFKDQDLGSIFHDNEGNELTFNSFYGVDKYGKAIVQEEMVEMFLNNIKLKPNVVEVGETDLVE